MGRRRCDIDAVNLGEIRTADAKELGAHVERCLIPFLLHESSLPHLLGQASPLGPISPLLEILIELPIALCHLLLAKLVTFLLLLQHEQQVFLPVALQILRDLFLARLYPGIPQRSQFMRIAFARQNGLEDGPRGFSDYAGPDNHSRLTQLPCCLPPTQNGVGILIYGLFAAQSPRPSMPLVYASSDTSRCPQQDSRSGWIRYFLSCRVGPLARESS
jgi:hypothetical protein